MSLFLTILGVLSAAISTATLKNGPRSLAYLHAVYEVCVPTALAMALAHPPVRDAAIALAAAMALLVGVLSISAAVYQREEAQRASALAVRPGAVRRLRQVRRWTVDLDAHLRDLQHPEG